jgi:predicted metallo-beta-lactamase superfamily hydrolase
MRVKLELDALILAIQDAEVATDREYFDWLKANVPEMFSIKGRPNWIVSEKVKGQDEALLKDFEDTLARNIAVIGKKHRASQKTYSDLADKYGDEDEETVKQRVMRARRRQKALNETIQDILRLAAPAETDRGKVIAPKEYEERREKLLEAFRRILRKK